jgi:hypothetical protein
MPIGNCSFLPVSDAVQVTSDLCPVCRSKMIVRAASEVVIRNAILKVDAPTGRVTAKCGRCKAWREVPLRYVG